MGGVATPLAGQMLPTVSSPGRQVLISKYISPKISLKIILLNITRKIYLKISRNTHLIN